MANFLSWKWIDFRMKKKKKNGLCILKEASRNECKRMSPLGFFSSFKDCFQIWFKKNLIPLPNGYVDSGVLFFWRCTVGCVLMFVQDKLQSLAAGHSDILETLSPKVRKRVEVLREIQVSLPQNAISYEFCFSMVCIFV